MVAPSDDRILGCLARYYYLTSKQVCRLLYSDRSLTYIQAKLKMLTDAGFAQRIWLPKRQPHGSPPAVYTLSRRGINYLTRLGMELHRRYHPSEKEALSYFFLAHTLELNDFLISAEIFCRGLGDFTLARMMHEQELKRAPVFVLDSEGKRTGVIPDAWLDLRIHGTFQVCLAVELDRGTEEQKKWRRKVANLLAYAAGPYQERFGTRSLTIAVATTAGERRLMELLDWTQAELEARREKSQADLFLFTAFYANTVDAEHLFLSPRWYQPFRKEPLALLESADWSS